MIAQRRGEIHSDGDDCVNNRQGRDGKKDRKCREHDSGQRGLALTWANGRFGLSENLPVRSLYHP